MLATNRVYPLLLCHLIAKETEILNIYFFTAGTGIFYNAATTSGI